MHMQVKNKAKRLTQSELNTFPINLYHISFEIKIYEHQTFLVMIPLWDLEVQGRKCKLT